MGTNLEPEHYKIVCEAWGAAFPPTYACERFKKEIIPLLKHAKIDDPYVQERIQCIMLECRLMAAAEALENKSVLAEMERLQDTIHIDVVNTTGIVKNSLKIGISAGMIILCLVGGTMGYLGYKLGYDNGHAKGQKGEYDVAYSSGFKAGYAGGMDNSLPPRVIRSPEEDAKNEFKNQVRMCISKSGNRVAIAPIAKGKGGEKLACFPAEGDGWWLE